ncbi:MAG: hypothetical protein E6J70_12455 [Deltaproteobacteria bacterium]|nr:MAG: hypothetical protein E6J70_12455 [Deltaproteobacteria bacterium]
MTYEQILCRRDGPVATIVLNRPEKLNAFTFRMLGEIHAALDTLLLDDLRALVFTGAGRAFSAGDDLIDMGGTDPAEDIRRGHHRLITRLRGVRLPVVAALNGYTLGAAFDLALACLDERGGVLAAAYHRDDAGHRDPAPRRTCAGAPGARARPGPSGRPARRAGRRGRGLRRPPARAAAGRPRRTEGVHRIRPVARPAGRARVRDERADPRLRARRVA